MLARTSVAFVSIVLLLSACAAPAQTQADCSQNLFNLNPGSTWIYPFAINDYGTIVGLAQVASPDNVAFIDWSGGGITYPFGQHVVSMLSGRNDQGTSIGYSGTGQNSILLLGVPTMMGPPILLNGNTWTPITFSVPTGQQLNVNSINKFDTIVGAGNIGDGLKFHGFKRWSNGNVVMLDYPGAVQTVPTSINDGGGIVGYYTDSTGASHGFLYVNGAWATIDYPNATGTSLAGISNDGMIVGNASVNGNQTAFIYKNGIFKYFWITNNPSNSVYVIAGISAQKDFILITNWNWLQGFTATCQ
ncbi:MAG TPA: hypothetical protein VJ728_04460 [Candidatus Binataceae bacterium]|nr:hypothetical protein [Candidatus Binataceae bacterium]